MKASRDSKGRFVKGHRGFKMVGAKSRKKKRIHSYHDILLEFLIEEINKNISYLTANERVSLYLKLLTSIVPDTKRVRYEDQIRPPAKSHSEKLPKTVNVIINSIENQQYKVIKN